jgi:predicted aminopeptidase
MCMYVCKLCIPMHSLATKLQYIKSDMPLKESMRTIVETISQKREHEDNCGNYFSKESMRKLFLESNTNATNINQATIQVKQGQNHLGVKSLPQLHDQTASIISAPLTQLRQRFGQSLLILCSKKSIYLALGQNQSYTLRFNYL